MFPIFFNLWNWGQDCPLSKADAIYTVLYCYQSKSFHLHVSQIRYFVRIKIFMFSFIICLFYLNFITEIIERKNKFGNPYLCVYFLQFSYLQNAIIFSHFLKIDCLSKATKIRIAFLLVIKMWNELRKNVNSTRNKCVIIPPLEHFFYLSRLGEFCMIWGVYLQIHCSTIWSTLYGSIPWYTHSTCSTGFMQVAW